MNDLILKLQEVRPYIFNIKALFGIILILFGIYTGSTDLPILFKKYNDTKDSNENLMQSKQNLNVEEAKLKSISKELDKLTTKPIKIEQGNSPELIVINIAQKLIQLSENTNNTYISLQPSQPIIYNIDNAVTLPVNIPGISDSNTTSSQSSNINSNENNSQTTLNAFQYTLLLKGTYISLATFVQELVKLSDFILINTITLSQSIDGTTTENMNKETDILMKIEFSIPWQQ